MKNILLGSAVAALALSLPVAAQAQRLAAPVIAVVNTDQILEQCTACVAANAQLQAQGQQVQQRFQQLQQSLQTEGQPIQAAVNALQGRQPDAALQARIRAFQTNEQNAQTEITARREQLQRNLAFVRQQIYQRLGPVVTQIAQQRGATVALDRNATLWSADALDITPAVLVGLNAALPSVNVNAPAQPQQGAQPQQQTPPRTGGR